MPCKEHPDPKNDTLIFFNFFFKFKYLAFTFHFFWQTYNGDYNYNLTLTNHPVMKQKGTRYANNKHCVISVNYLGFIVST